MNPAVPADSGAGGGDLSIARLVEEEGQGVEVFLNDGSSFRVAGDAPELRGLRPGRPLTAPELEGLRDAADRREIARRVFAWLERRAHARGRLRQKLIDLDFNPRSVDVVLDQFEARGLLDDEKFARLFVGDQLRKRPVGTLWLLAKLREQGVEREVADCVVAEELPPEVELAQARRALSKRSPTEDPAKSLRFLSGRGFRQSIARRAAAERFHGDAGAGD
jgi:regulatory protein